MALNVEHLLRTANTLEQALLALRQHGNPDDHQRAKVVGLP